MRFELKAPASPFSPVINRSSIRFSGRTTKSGFGPLSSPRSRLGLSACTAATTFDSICRSSDAYGRAEITRSCARRSLAAETIFMALVICCVFFTERMRRRMSIRLGIALRGLLLLGGEAPFELLDGVLQLRAQRVIQRLLLTNLRPDPRMRV